ncbi:hypothetical protein GGH99_002924 [Coemansia sp. RSA 1285]|nr:hypothetical protein GGH99_002924 [Coemansia sp. RSA 1285]
MVTTGRPGNKSVTVDQLRKLVKVPMVWKLSTFAPVGEKPSMVAGTDVSPEESRLEFAMAQRQQQQQQLLGGGYSSVAEACQKYDQLVQDMDRRLGDIDGNAPAYATQWNQMHGGGAAAGGGGLGTQSAFGQQASAFGQQTSAFGGNIGSGGSGSAFGSGSGSLSFLGGSKPSFSPTVTVASFGNTPQEIMEATGPRRDLTAEESDQFRAQAFVYGRIPEVPPTPELCSH